MPVLCPKVLPVLLAGVALLLGSCAVYAPTIPATPLLEKKQVEVVASLRSLVAFDGSVAWAPTTHLLVVGEAAALQNNGSYSDQSVDLTYTDYHRQGGLGLGYYQAPTATRPAYWAAVGGVGFASTSLHAVDVGPPGFLFIPATEYRGHYQAQYRRYYGQLYAAWPRPQGLTCGASLRGTVADYTSLTLEGQPIAPVNRVFLEPTFFMRFGQRALRGQVTAGLSLPLSDDRNNPTAKRTAPLSYLFSIGLVIRPDLLLKKQP